MPTARASAWWHGSRPTIAWCWSNERAPYLHPPGAARCTRAFSVDAAVLPGAVRFCLEDQPVANRDRAAALSAGVRPGARRCCNQGGLRGVVDRQFQITGFRRPLCPVLPPHPRRPNVLAPNPPPTPLPHLLRHGAAAEALAGD